MYAIVATRITAALLFAALHVGSALAQSPWSYVPGKGDGGVLQDLKAVRPIEGCTLPGGLQSVVGNPDEPSTSAPFWCGAPPFCLTNASVGVNEVCDMVPYSRREPRYDPNGAPGVNSVRHPYDLRCRNTGNMPLAVSTGSAANPAEDGRCPPPCPAQTFVNGSCSFNIPQRNHTESASASYRSGYISGNMSAACYLGAWTVTSSSCVDRTPAPPPSPPSGGGGGGSGGNGGIPVAQNCNQRTISLRAQVYECYTGRNYCSYNLPNMTDGTRRSLRGSTADYCGGGADAWVDVSCRNGTYVVNSYSCWMSDGGS